MPYEDIRNPDLPWGYWLTVRDVPGLDGPIVDEHGAAWKSIREAFWIGRMRMSARADDADEQLERMTAALTALDRRSVNPREAALDIFDGEQLFRDFYRSWLAGHELSVIGPTGGTDLTTEGRAVLLMLTATRSMRPGPLPFGPDAIMGTPMPDVSRERREIWFAEIGRFGARLPCRFERVSIGDSFAILLHGDGFGHRMPVRRVIWSQAFLDVETRDRLFYWLAVRVDRWAHWGQRAWEEGAAAFTQYLLELVATGLPGAGTSGAPMLALGGPAPRPV